MATDFIEQLRNAKFPTERRSGYSREAVDAYLGELADWLETGGGDQARSALVQREMERVGERTGTILSAAQESADRITAEAAAEAARLRGDAERDVAELRAAADAYATEVRVSADEEVRASSERTARGAAEAKAEADDHARLTIRDADARLALAEQKASEIKREAEAKLADLARKREEVIANVDELASGLRSVVDGPGSTDLELPEGIDDSELTIRRGSQEETVAEHRAVGLRAAVPPEEPAERRQGTSYTPPSDEPTAPTEPAPFDDGYESDEDGYEADEQEVRRRRASVDNAEGPTEETKLTELL